MAASMALVEDSGPIALEPLSSCRRSVDGHYGITDRVEEHLANGTNIPYPPTARLARSASGLQGSAIIDIAEERSVGQESEDYYVPEKTRRRRFRDRFRPAPEPSDVLETKTRMLEDTALGYPRLAAFQAADPSYSLYRGFAYLHSRLLLDLQDELTTLEQELEDLDWEDHGENPDRLRSREIDVDRAAQEGAARNRRQLLEEIKTKLTEYDDLLMKAGAVRALQKPSERMYMMIRRFHHNNRPLMDAETDAIRCKDDIITLRSGRELATFDTWVESGIERTLLKIDDTLRKLFRMRQLPLLRLLRTYELRKLTGDQHINFYSSSRISKVVSVLVSIVVLVLLVSPLVSIYRLMHPYNDKSIIKSLCVLTAFALLFATIMSTITMGTRYEIFAASAAYCALLLVFISGSSK